VCGLPSAGATAEFRSHQASLVQAKSLQRIVQLLSRCRCKERRRGWQIEDLRSRSTDHQVERISTAAMHRAVAVHIEVMAHRGITGVEMDKWRTGEIHRVGLRRHAAVRSFQAVRCSLLIRACADTPFGQGDLVRAIQDQRDCRCALAVWISKSLARGIVEIAALKIVMPRHVRGNRDGEPMLWIGVGGSGSRCRRRCLARHGRIA
jgi:hypothetical protein